MESPEVTNNNVSVEEAIAEGRHLLEKVLSEVEPGSFVEIERYSPSASMAVVAHRFTGDMDVFKKQIDFSFTDAAEALLPGQRLRVTITD